MLANRALSTPCRRGQLRVLASGNGAPPKFAEGAAVKVVKPVKIFHAPKHPDGIDLEGMQGKFVKDVTEFKGMTLSANLPIKVAFELEKDGAKVKFQVHLVGGRRGQGGAHGPPASMHARMQGCSMGCRVGCSSHEAPPGVHAKAGEDALLL